MISRHCPVLPIDQLPKELRETYEEFTLALSKDDSKKARNAIGLILNHYVDKQMEIPTEIESSYIRLALQEEEQQLRSITVRSLDFKSFVKIVTTTAFCIGVLAGIICPVGLASLLAAKITGMSFEGLQATIINILLFPVCITLLGVITALISYGPFELFLSFISGLRMTGDFDEAKKRYRNDDKIRIFKQVGDGQFKYMVEVSRELSFPRDLKDR